MMVSLFISWTTICHGLQLTLVVTAKEQAETLASELVQSHGRLEDVPEKDLALLKRAWDRYAKQLVKWTKYYDDCDLYDLSQMTKAGQTGSAKPLNRPLDLDENDIDVERVLSLRSGSLNDEANQAVEADSGANNLLTVLQDGHSYGYQASHLETVLMSQSLDTIEDVSHYIELNNDLPAELVAGPSDATLASDEYQPVPSFPLLYDNDIVDLEQAVSLAQKLTEDSLIDPTLLSLSTASTKVPSTTTASVASRNPAAGKRSISDEGEDFDELDGDESPDHTETVFIDHLATMQTLSLNKQESPTDARFKLFELATSLPKKSMNWRGYRADHFPTNGICPAHDKDISSCAGPDKQRAHVHAAMEQKAMQAAGPKLAKTLPIASTTSLFRAPKGERRSLPKSLGIGIQAYYAENSCSNEGYTLDCNLCDTTYVIYSIGQASSHYALLHDIFFPPTWFARKSAAASTEIVPWGPDDMLPIHARWDADAARYLIHLKDLELASKEAHGKMIALCQAQAAAYGTRDDVDISDDILTGTLRNAGADIKYSLVKAYGSAPTQTGTCIICVNSDDLSYTDAMREYDTAQTQREHSYTCLKRTLSDLNGFLNGK